MERERHTDRHIYLMERERDPNILWSRRDKDNIFYEETDRQRDRDTIIYFMEREREREILYLLG